MLSHLQNPEPNPFGGLTREENEAYREIGQGKEAKSNPPEDVRGAWSQVASGAWLMGALALRARDWPRLRQAETVARDATNRASPDGLLLRAIFGGENTPPDMGNKVLAACLEAGKTASKEAIATARKAVQDNAASRAAIRKAASPQAAREAARKAAFAAKQAPKNAAKLAEFTPGTVVVFRNLRVEKRYGVYAEVDINSPVGQWDGVKERQYVVQSARIGGGEVYVCIEECK